jgi:hypothetical protein
MENSINTPPKMKYVPILLNWINKKSKEKDIILKFKLKVTFSETANFLVQFPTNEKDWLIKEYTQIEWSKELELTNPNNVYLKVFLTSNNILNDMQVKLEIIQLGIENTELSMNENFQVGFNFSLNEWLILKW